MLHQPSWRVWHLSYRSTEDFPVAGRRESQFQQALAEVAARIVDAAQAHPR
ncbi:hypothetical protein ACQ86B_09905 [Mycolicibacterium aichiense]|uniref:hypothetical protein n=1 Tax=Mycolicibacterium aichiense TaxID=1799 RepID=UPI003D6651BA